VDVHLGHLDLDLGIANRLFFYVPTVAAGARV
jgi:hypothetical protein